MVTLKDITAIKNVDINYCSQGIDYEKSFNGVQFQILMLTQMRKRDFDSLYDLVIATCKSVLCNEKLLRDLECIDAFEVILYDYDGYYQRIVK